MVLFLSFCFCHASCCLPGRYNVSTHPMTASVTLIEALDPLIWAICVVLYRCISLTVKTGWTDMHSFVANDFAIKRTVAYYHSKTLLSICMIWVLASDDGCHFGNHCHWRAGNVIIKIEVDRITLITTLIYGLVL